MSKRRRQSQQVNQPHKEPNNNSLIVAIIGAVALIVAAIFGCLGSVLSPAVPLVIEVTRTSMAETSIALITRTAEVLSTNVALSTQNYLNQTTDTPIPSITPTNTPTQTSAPTQTSTPTPSVTPIEIKPVRYEYNVEVGDTLKEISKKYFITDFYASAIGRANCNQSPVAGDVLIIKYYYIQQGDSLSLLADRFGSKVGFLRFVNNLSEAVDLLPAGQILILAGSCAG